MHRARTPGCRSQKSGACPGVRGPPTREAQGVAASQPVRVMVEIDNGAETISGLIAVEGAPAGTFYGWLELIDRLERATSPRGAETDPASGSPREGS